MTIRELIEANERKVLSSKACLSSESRGRRSKEKESDCRTVYMRDRDRILHSQSFRRLMHKTQVFFNASNDFYRTRLTHTLEVSGIARTIAKGLFLNEDLTEAIALGHDLGHPPFGHVGESTINELYKYSFKHQVQSLRVVDHLENGKGLNLTYEVRDGILKHSKGMQGTLPQNRKNKAVTLEGQIVRIADRISYLNHDIDDAIQSGILKQSDIPKSILNILGERYSQRINTMVVDVIQTSHQSNDIEMSYNILEQCENLKNFLYNKVYNHPRIQDEAVKVKKIITDLFLFFKSNPEIIIDKTSYIEYKKNISLERRIVDYLSMMTDSFALRSYEKYLIPKKWFKLELT